MLKNGHQDHRHDHNHDYNHTHGHDRDEFGHVCGGCDDCGFGDGCQHDGIIDKKQQIMLFVGALLFAAGLVCEYKAHLSPVMAILYVLSYLTLGQNVLWHASQNLIKGRVMDENFLMSIATVGALAIGDFGEAAAVMLFYQVGEFFQDYALNRSRLSITSLMDIRPDYANVIRAGKTLTVPPDDVKLGELILIKPGEKVPLDGIVIEGLSTLDTSSLSGESLPREIAAGDAIPSGCVNLSGVITVRVEKKSGDSTVTKILALVEDAQQKKAPTEQFISKFSRYYTPVVVAMAVLIAFVPPILEQGAFTEWLHRGLVFLVVSCPCALVISIPLSFFGGVGAAAKRGILVKGGNYLEALDNLKAVVFDKTGTLTQGRFSVSQIIPAKGFDKSYVFEMAAAVESLSPHPLAKSICAKAGRLAANMAVADYTLIDGRGVKAKVNGKRILAGSLSLMSEHHISINKSQSKNAYHDKTGARVYISIDGRYAGLILLTDDVKDDSALTIQSLHARGIRTVMLTGDNLETAQAIAKALNIDDVRAGLMPDQKAAALKEQMSIGEELRNTVATDPMYVFKPSESGKTAFVGDGINDAPSLALADVGVAMGGLGSDAALEAADVVLMTDKPYKIIEAIEIAATTKKIVWQNIIFSLGVKVIVLTLGALGISGMWEAVFADVGVALIAILNAMRILYLTRS